MLLRNIPTHQEICMTDAKSRGGVQIGSTISAGRTTASKIDDELAQSLNHLLHLGYDLSGAYKMALSRLEDSELKQSLDYLDKSHEGLLEDLATCVSSLGKTPTTSGDLHGLLERGRVLLGDLRGDDGILRAMATNEADMCSAYKKVLEQPGLPPEIAVVITSALAHENRHKAIYERLLAG